MSDFQKQRSGVTPIKNPLLSASVTGLTFDDFPNKPLLLPAAPAIVHSPLQTSVLAPTGLVTREPKSLVTVGSSLDNESLDEINLNSSIEDNQTSEVTDPNANPLLDQTNQSVISDSILSQTASSFSALPSVASNVFSTFSKRITSISSRETTPTYDSNQPDSNANISVPQLDLRPTFVQQENLTQPLPQFYNQPSSTNISFSTSLSTSNQHNIPSNLPPTEPPKFYTPADVPPLPALSAPPPTNLGGQNNFRFSSKKKLYAPIPGLSDQIQKPTATLDPLPVNSAIPYDSSYGANISNNYYSQSPFFPAEEQKPEERKPASGFFSKISNFAPSGVLENITGLVKSATGSLIPTNTTDTDSYTAAPPPVFDQQNNFFVVHSPPTNYFVTPQTLLEGQQTNNQLGLTVGGKTNEAETCHLVTTQQQSIIPAPTEYSPQIQTPIELAFQSAPPQTLYANRAPLNLSSAHLPPTAETITTNFNTTQSVATASQVPFFDPTKYLPPSGQTTAAAQLNPTSLPLPPPLPAASGHPCYRLQKGTRLYKSPLTAQETAPIQVTPNQIQPTTTCEYFSQDTFVTPQSVPLFVPPIVADQSISVIEPSSTFATGTVASQSTQSFSLFATPDSLVDSLAQQSVPAVNDRKSNEAAFDVSNRQIRHRSSLDSPVGETNNTVEQVSVSFAPPVKKHKSDETIQDVLNFNELLVTNVPEQATVAETKKVFESFENKFVAEIPKQNYISANDDNAQIEPIFEPIEPVLEENTIEVQKDTVEDPLEETLQKLSLAESSTASKTVQLPPIAQSFNLKNPYRSDSTSETEKHTTTLPTLANFFTPEPSNDSSNFNLFSALPATHSSGSGIHFISESVDTEINEENSALLQTTNIFATPLEPATVVYPPISAFFSPSSGSLPANLEAKNVITKDLNESIAAEHVPPPIGIENFIQSKETLSPIKPNNTTVYSNSTPVKPAIVRQIEQQQIVNQFSNYFSQTKQQLSEVVKDSSAFFDSISDQSLTQPQQQLQQQELPAPPTVATNEEQRLQNFFNNPPPKDAGNVGDLNYDLVHSGLGVKNLQHRSLTSVSNLVEPPSSACSEFSEISNSTAGQKFIAANLSFNESSDKLIEKEEAHESATEERTIEILSSSNNIKYYEELPEEILKELQMADKMATSPAASVSYKPVVKHWFYKQTINEKQQWLPFSHYDSALLETSLLMEDEERANIVAVEGGRYDVNIGERKKISVYWDSEPIEVRRCSWFYKAIDSKYIPYEEQTAELLESEYQQAVESGAWHKTIEFGMGEKVVFHGPTVMMHYQQQQNADAWGGGTTQTSTRPRVVKRDLDDFNIEQGESQKVDHLLFMVHGIGSACDLKLRSVEEVVESFRTIARQLVQSHYKNSIDLGVVGRVEVLPISWHSRLHSVEEGIDEKLRMITLESIPKLRNFTNDALLDVLFYTSPTYCQKIMNTIMSSMNTFYLKYRERHPEFNGGVSLAGHSLGSLILFDLLCHQNPIKESEDKNLENPDKFLTQMDSNQLEDSQMSYTMGPAGTGQPFINYGQLIFQPKKFFALGSPIGMFVTIRGIDKLGLDFRLPTCPGLYNIFHPYDPVAYRIEALVNPDLSVVRPVLIPHHKGRKRMHLELKETIARLSTDLKNRFMDKFKMTLESVNIFGSPSKSTKEAEEMMEQEVEKVIQMQIQLEQQNNQGNANDNSCTGSDYRSETAATSRPRTDSGSTAMSDDMVEIDFPLGKLNDSKRIDYVLQEAPLEFINDYICALHSHACYWESADTILFIMKEIYSGLGISPDSQVPQQTMTIERPASYQSLNLLPKQKK